MDSQNSGQNCNSPPLSSTSQGSAGCGCPSDITLNITPTTGGSWHIRVDPQTSIENFKKIVSKKLKVHKERICLLYRDKQLRDGSLLENGLVDGSRLTLLPSVETGLLAQRPELSVMQALESLNDNQVNDFLSGKAPLNLTMRLGDHMMLIQLQLSTVTAGTSSSSSSSSNNNTSNTNVHQVTFNVNNKSVTHTTSTSPSTHFEHSSRAKTPAGVHPIKRHLTTLPSETNANKKIATHHTSSRTKTSSPNPTKRPPLGGLKILSDMPIALPVAKDETAPTKTNTTTQTVQEPMDVSSSIKSLSDLATRPTVPVPTAARIPQSRSPPHHSSSTDPIAAGLTSCLCTSLSPPCSCMSNNQSTSSNIESAATNSHQSTPSPTRLDTRALAQASRNLTQTLRQLSTEVLSSREIEQRAQGAIIESMQHHGRGVYSGTFSGTLNPALQDSRGRPRRDISTIVHILNDLLCAAPPVRRTEPSVHTQNAMPMSPKTATPCDCSKCNNNRCTASTSTASTSASNQQIISLPLDSNAEQNSRTRDKIEQLRLVMGERRERRRLRKEKIQPYTIPSEATSTTADAVSA